jgi:hypothetical protein
MIIVESTAYSSRKLNGYETALRVLRLGLNRSDINDILPTNARREILIKGCYPYIFYNLLSQYPKLLSISRVIAPLRTYPPWRLI